MKYFFRVEYSGTDFGGWQRQNNTPTIQETLETAFATATRTQCTVTGAGRTDAGVHALGQGAHLEVSTAIDPGLCELSVNALLPPAIAIYHLQQIDESFHARFSAVSRRYRYFMCDRKRPLLYKKVWMLFYRINWDIVHKNIACLKGIHDFSAFCASGSSARHANCTVLDASLEQDGDCTVFTIEANRFVYSMVRSLTGTLIDIGRGKITDPLEDILYSKDRSRAGATAPACGLVLDKVTYSGVD